MPSGPHWLWNAPVWMLMSLFTSRAVLISSFMVTNTPLPLASLEAATLTALTRFNAPSADRAVPGRMEPTTAMGLSVCTVRLRK